MDSIGREEWKVTFLTTLGITLVEWTESEEWVEHLKETRNVIKVERAIHVLDF